MSKPKPKPAKKPDPHTKPVKIEGTFDALIRKSLAVKKPAAGWPKEMKP